MSLYDDVVAGYVADISEVELRWKSLLASDRASMSLDEVREHIDAEMKSFNRILELKCQLGCYVYDFHMRMAGSAA
ncbi:MAG TPA: hypothetical protein VLC91_13875 [Spongiibacteraceae bacterium]|nr:hypothetical protein [Spongiibacteraceae bacterium]